MRSFWTRRRAVYAMVALAMAALTGGYSLAAGLTSTSVAQTASVFSITTSASAAFPNPPSVGVAAVPAAVSACTSAPVSLGSGGTAVLVLAASASIVCTTNDFAERFNFTSLATASAGSYTFTSYDSYGATPTTGASAGSISIASALTSAGTVSVYVDFGAPSPPAGGIGSLSMVVG